MLLLQHLACQGPFLQAVAPSPASAPVPVVWPSLFRLPGKADGLSEEGVQAIVEICRTAKSAGRSILMRSLAHIDPKKKGNSNADIKQLDGRNIYFCLVLLYCRFNQSSYV